MTAIRGHIEEVLGRGPEGRDEGEIIALPLESPPVGRPDPSVAIVLTEVSQYGGEEAGVGDPLGINYAMGPGTHHV